jgi:hypothetical protein
MNCGLVVTSQNLKIVVGGNHAVLRITAAVKEFRNHPQSKNCILFYGCAAILFPETFSS